ATSPGSPRRSAAAPGSAGTSTTRTSSPAASGSSVPATWPTWSAPGSRPWTGSRTSWPAAPTSPTCAAAMPPPWRVSPLVGCDYRAASIDQARKRAAEAGVADRCRFEVASAKDYPAGGYDLVATFDCLHDMGDPVGAAAHVLDTLAPDGTWMIVEP